MMMVKSQRNSIVPSAGSISRNPVTLSLLMSPLRNKVLHMIGINRTDRQVNTWTDKVYSW